MEADAVPHTAPEGAEEPVAARAWVDAVVPLALGALVAWATWPALAPSSLWIDDAWVALASKASSPGQLLEATITTPGFTALLWAWLRLVGLDGLGGAAAQALPLAFGMAAPGALWLGLRRRCHWTAVPALVAATMVATSPLVVEQASRVKQYTLDVLLAAVLTTWAIGLTYRFSRSGRWWLTAAACGAIVLSASTATVAGAAVVVAWGAAASWQAGGALADVRWRAAWRTAGPVAAFLAFGAAWQALVLSRTVPEGMFRFWEAHYLPVDEGAAAVADAAWSGLFDVADAAVALPAFLTLLLAVVGVVRWARACPGVGAMVVLPVLAALGLALLQLAPWGAGRTDAHLVVPLCLGVGAALAPPMREAVGPLRAWALRPAIPFAALVVVAFAASSIVRPTYPQEDLRPLLAVLEEGWQPGEVILVYPFARLSYALYTDADVTFKPNEGSSLGYAVDVEDDRVVLLPAWRRDPSQYAPVVADATAGACGAWLPATHVSEDLTDVKLALEAAGFRQVGTGWGGDGATLSHWRHPDRAC